MIFDGVLLYLALPDMLDTVAQFPSTIKHCAAMIGWRPLLLFPPQHSACRRSGSRRHLMNKEVDAKTDGFLG